ncbi:phosphatidylinositol 4-kinase type II subunit alpha [Gigaspora margarita]|uniref:Phosphatidylinositol 4-kinase n=2 Tax=Gigaspora margarita TaxID=4874 RepID=A0A8H4EHT3_GIGMA|nr:phosphatidylinositol 4-kinase type II subunit alpha [Gigaspora margarita]
MIRTNNNPLSGYVKLQQEDLFEQDEYFDTARSIYDRNTDFIITRPHYQRRALSETRQSRHKSLPDSIMENSQSNEPEIRRNSEELHDDSSSSRRSSAWSQISRKLKFKGSSKGLHNKELELHKTVFRQINNLEHMQPSSPPLTANHSPPLTPELFNEIVNSVKAAIHSDVRPTRISQGSSGSYFCRNIDEKIVGVFKPKNEEPYGRLNPKWTKWIHRNLFPCFFGRSCLIPNLGYISEAAASLLDRRLNLNIVPLTEVTWLSSTSFHYDYLDRRAARSTKNPKPLPDKIGSFQVYLEGFKDAHIFLRENPWPENFYANHITGNERNNKSLNSFMCGKSSTLDDENDLYESSPLGKRFSWTPELQLQFREQFEKLVILDYLMRNTDRGLDNWMIKYCEKDENDCTIITPPKLKVMKTPDVLSKNSANSSNSEPATMLPSVKSSKDAPQLSSDDIQHPLSADSLSPDPSVLPSKSTTSEPPQSTSSILNGVGKDDTNTSQSFNVSYPHIHVAAIDNGLAFPFKHPDQWRSYPYGWLSLPDALIGQPFTANTRNHFLPMLTDPNWWKKTISELRNYFRRDTDFDNGMFTKQIAVLKGQGWNIVETLAQADKGIKDLCACRNAVVWDEVEVIEIPEDPYTERDRNSSGADIANRVHGESNRIPSPVGEEEEEDHLASRVDGLPITPRRSLDESSSARHSSLSTSAPASSYHSNITAGKHKWSETINRVKEKLNKKNKPSMESRKIKQVLVERLEIVSGSTPFFTCC